MANDAKDEGIQVFLEKEDEEQQEPMEEEQQDVRNEEKSTFVSEGQARNFTLLTWSRRSSDPFWSPDRRTTGLSSTNGSPDEEIDVVCDLSCCLHRMVQMRAR
jgi:hypothetical protein